MIFKKKIILWLIILLFLIFDHLKQTRTCSVPARCAQTLLCWHMPQHHLSCQTTIFHDNLLFYFFSLSTYQPVNFYCQKLHGVVAEYPGFASYWELPTQNHGSDSSQNFIASGLVVSSDLKVQTTPCKRVYYKTRKLKNLF